MRLIIKITIIHSDFNDQSIKLWKLSKFPFLSWSVITHHFTDHNINQHNPPSLKSSLKATSGSWEKSAGKSLWIRFLIKNRHHKDCHRHCHQYCPSQQNLDVSWCACLPWCARLLRPLGPGLQAWLQHCSLSPWNYHDRWCCHYHHAHGDVSKKIKVMTVAPVSTRDARGSIGLLRGGAGDIFFGAGRGRDQNSRGGARVKPSRGGAFSGQGKKTVKQ